MKTRLILLTIPLTILTACARATPVSTPNAVTSIIPPPSLVVTATPSASLAAPTPTTKVATAPTTAIPPSARPLTLTTLGEARQLPNKLLGASVESLIEHVIDDPRKVAAIKWTAPAVIRFPGGSQANYYNWRDGKLHFDPQPNSSSYYKFWAGVALQINRSFANGVHYEEYATFANQIGSADIVIVPNLETSSVAEQAAWFKQLQSENLAPKNVELGNEFWVAMANDPNVIKKWPDEKSALAVMQQYTAALRPFVGADAKFAVQASAASFTHAANDPRPFDRRLLQWDADLAPADWFQAVTAHLYPDPTEVTASAGTLSPQQFFELMMARSDAGVDRALNDIAKKLPGKEIWVTEWNPRGGRPDDIIDPSRTVVQPAMNAQLTARTELALLRHPEVTTAQYFTLYAGDNPTLQMYVPSGGQYLPLPPAVVVGWFDDAANGGATFQRVVETNGQVISDLGSFKESYRPIEGGVFKSGKRTVLILQNASNETRGYDPTQLNAAKPSRIELLVTSDLTSASHAPAQVTPLDPSAPIVLPPLSIVRVTWE